MESSIILFYFYFLDKKIMCEIGLPFKLKHNWVSDFFVGT